MCTGVNSFLGLCRKLYFVSLQPSLKLLVPIGALVVNLATQLLNTLHRSRWFLGQFCLHGLFLHLKCKSCIKLVIRQSLKFVIAKKINWLLLIRWTTILVIIFWDFLMFCQIFLSPQVERIVIIGNKHGIYELHHQLPNNLTLRILGN